jgi:hypothetical protein
MTVVILVAAYSGIDILGARLYFIPEGIKYIMG